MHTVTSENSPQQIAYLVIFNTSDAVATQHGNGLPIVRPLVIHPEERYAQTTTEKPIGSQETSTSISFLRVRKGRRTSWDFHRSGKKTLRVCDHRQIFAQCPARRELEADGQRKNKVVPTLSLFCSGRTPIMHPALRTK